MTEFDLLDKNEPYSHGYFPRIQFQTSELPKFCVDTSAWVPTKKNLSTLQQVHENVREW